MTHSEIRDVLFRYLEHYRYPPEADQLIRLVRALDEGHDVTSRNEFRIGHVTVGAVVIDQHRRVLMVKHTAPEEWLPPGGHLKYEDTSLVGASLRGLQEETGITSDHIASPPDADAIPFDIDTRQIPADPFWDAPEHWHFDFRYAHWVDETEVRPLLDKADGCAWFSADALSMSGLRDKLGTVGVG
ncbi:NUDIX hydrolase [Allosalinactinospora lopnorensis]|uniref:NUDIX hydrolase n=1 Tax=Allosalinactinospora lopnorensis TaxID=1352348 RepID=UPI00138F2E9C|nr:NUDIX domain-containing protein [Allosalinactinospora lopnorensis]